MINDVYSSSLLISILFVFSLHCASGALLLVRSLRTNLWLCFWELIKLAVFFIESFCVAAVDGCRSKKHNISLCIQCTHTHKHTHKQSSLQPVMDILTKQTLERHIIAPPMSWSSPDCHCYKIDESWCIFL